MRGYVYGKSIHMVLRDHQYLKKQLLYAIGQKILHTITLNMIMDYWTSSVRGYPSFENLDLYHAYVDMWAVSLKTVIIHDIINIVNTCYGDTSRNYELYVDWVVTLGIVPFFFREKKHTELPDKVYQSTMIKQIIARDISFYNKLYTMLSNITVCNFDNVVIYRRVKDIHTFHNGRLINTAIVRQPVFLTADITVFATPLQHLYYEILRFDNLRQHRKLCQLLNTYPIKALTVGRDEVDNQKLLDLLERQEKPNDAKKCIIKFLLNLSESRSRVGIEDSVDSFIQELTPSVIDHTKMFPNRLAPYHPPTQNRDVRDLFRKQIMRCLEEQIKDQTTEIDALKQVNVAQENRIQDLQAMLEHQRTDDPYMDNQDFDTKPLIKNLDDMRRSSFRSTKVEEGRHVVNSFFSQYIPDVMHEEIRLNKIWEREYLRAFHLRKKFNNQGQDDGVVYTGETIDLITLPYLTQIHGLYDLLRVPAKYLEYSEYELISELYEDSMIPKYIYFMKMRAGAAHPK